MASIDTEHDALAVKPCSRRDVKREQTRHSLIEATKVLVSEQTNDKISIQDMTQKAGVGLGTFYNYFSNKQSVYEAVLDDMRTIFESQLSALRDTQNDPASLVAATLQFCFNEALNNQQWNNFVQRSGIEGEHFLLQSHEQCLEDVTQGSKRGRFKVDNPEFVASLIGGITRHVTREIRAGRMTSTATSDTTRYILRMLGLPELVAKAVTQAPLPPVAAQKRQTAKEILPFLNQPSRYTFKAR